MEPAGACLFKVIDSQIARRFLCPRAIRKALWPAALTEGDSQPLLTSEP